MNDQELESRLKSIRLPERSEEYWDDFPARVRVQLRRSEPVSVTQSVWGRRLKLAGTFALALGLMWFGERFHPLQTTSDLITRQSHALQAEMVQLQNGLNLVAFNPHGMGYLLGEAN
jgi:hypothetical protein